MTRSLNDHPQRILAIHLLNDRSGSPFVFSQALRALQEVNYEIHLFTATPSGDGFLSGIEGLQMHPLFYRWSPYKWKTLLLFLYSQLSLLLRILVFARRTDIVYINSMLPFGAAIGARIRGCRVVYHIHEVSVRPAALKNWLTAIIRHTACRCIYVSGYTREQTALEIPARVVYNALPAAFVEEAQKHKDAPVQPFTVLMACSLKRYKGVGVFVACARALPALRFELVLNAGDTDVQSWFHGQTLPENLAIYAACRDMHPFYRRASLVLNLSLPDEWIETFGMTILEAMCYGRPVIVPTVGGIVELVENGNTGLCLDSRNVSLIVAGIRKFSEDKSLYHRVSEAARKRAPAFGQEPFRRAVIDIMAGLPEKYFLQSSSKTISHE